MWFVILGVALAGMKLAEFGPVATWSWFIVLAPFALAVAWWGFADSVGLTQRRAMKKMDDRVAERRNKALEAMKVAEPQLMKAARQGQVHHNTASRKISRLTKRIAKLGK